MLTGPYVEWQIIIHKHLHQISPAIATATFGGMATTAPPTAPRSQSRLLLKNKSWSPKAFSVPYCNCSYPYKWKVSASSTPSPPLVRMPAVARLFLELNDLLVWFDFIMGRTSVNTKPGIRVRGLCANSFARCWRWLVRLRRRGCRTALAWVGMTGKVGTWATSYFLIEMLFRILEKINCL